MIGTLGAALYAREKDNGVYGRFIRKSELI